MGNGKIWQVLESMLLISDKIFPQEFVHLWDLESTFPNFSHMVVISCSGKGFYSKFRTLINFLGWTLKEDDMTGNLLIESKLLQNHFFNDRVLKKFFNEIDICFYFTSLMCKWMYILYWSVYYMMKIGEIK